MARMWDKISSLGGEKVRPKYDKRFGWETKHRDIYATITVAGSKSNWGLAAPENQSRISECDYPN